MLWEGDATLCVHPGILGIEHCRRPAPRSAVKLAKSKPSRTTFRPTPVSCGITERSLLYSIKSSLMRDFRVRSSLPVARPTADLSQPCIPPVGLSLATRSPGVGSQPCGAKYPRFCADSKSV